MGTNVLPGEPRSGPERLFTMGAPATRPLLRTTPKAHPPPPPPRRRCPPPPSPPPLAPQISSSRLNRLFYFISLSSGEQHRPSPSVSYSFSLFLSACGRTARLISGLHPLKRRAQNKEKSVQPHNATNYVFYLPFCGVDY